MQIWHYHPITRELLGTGQADPDPMNPGEWLFPAYSTITAPLAAAVGQVPVFNGQAWILMPDHRGETWWDGSAPVVVDFLGDPTARGLVAEAPEAPTVAPAPRVASARQIRLALNRLGLRQAVEDYVVSADQDTKDSWQFAGEFERNDAMIAAAASALGKSDPEIDALFDLAKTL